MPKQKIGKVIAGHGDSEIASSLMLRTGGTWGCSDTERFGPSRLRAAFASCACQRVALPLAGAGILQISGQVTIFKGSDGCTSLACTGAVQYRRQKSELYNVSDLIRPITLVWAVVQSVKEVDCDSQALAPRCSMLRVERRTNEIRPLSPAPLQTEPQQEPALARCICLGQASAASLH